MQYPIIDNLIYAYLKNGWTGLDIPETIKINYYQEGSGNPSPTNIRPINPGAVFNINGEEVPVYDGVVDVNNKTLTLNKYLLNANGIGLLYSVSNYSGIYYTVITNNLTPQSFVDGQVASNLFHSGGGVLPGNFYITGGGVILVSVLHNQTITTSAEARNWFVNNPSQFLYELDTQIIYNLTDSELGAIINGIFSNDIAHRLKLPLPHYFPHSVIDALISAADGQHTEEEKEVLRHYLTPLGIGGI